MDVLGTYESISHDPARNRSDALPSQGTARARILAVAYGVRGTKLTSGSGDPGLCISYQGRASLVLTRRMIRGELEAVL